MSESQARVVLKFGGTSVARPERWWVIADVVRSHLAEGRRPLVVCSAVAGVSNALEALLEASLLGKQAEVLARIESLHQPLVEGAGLGGRPILSEGMETLEKLATGIALTGECPPRLRARVMAQGELLSTRLGALILDKQGLQTAWRDARELLLSENQPGPESPLHYLSATCIHNPEPNLIARLEVLEADLVLTQGFIARDSAGDTVLLGRGGSDTSAAYLAACLSAVRCEIWTDVPGMFTANPRLLPSARMLRQLDYAEAQEIASTGAKVLHPRCLLPVRAQGIPLYIRCTTRPEQDGTVITARPATQGATVKAISARSGIVLVSMETVGMWQQVGFLADAFSIFKSRGLSIDLVSTSETNVTVSLDPSANVLNEEVLDGLARELSRLCQPRIIESCASVSLVGRGIRAILHQLAPVLELFEEHRIHLVSQAASDLNLTVVVDRDQEERLVRQLHGLLFKDGSSTALLGPSWEELFEPARDEAPPADRPWWADAREQLIELARQGTPVYAYDAATLDRQAAALMGLMSVDRALFAMKSNPNEAVLRRLHRAGLGFECVSTGELHHLLQIFGTEVFTERAVLFTPNFAPREEYLTGLKLGAQVTLDNLHPLEAWPDIFAGQSVFLRIDPGTGRGHHAHVRTAGSRSKFGISLEELDRASELATAAGATITGLHAHSGSGIRTPENWAQLGRLLAELIARFPQVRTIDVGGGLGIPEKPGQLPLDLAAFDSSLASLGLAERGVELWIEPGRFCVATAGVLLTRVTQLKTKGPVRYVGVDAGMHSLIRPALYGAYHQIENLSRLGEPRTITANVVGPICESGDTLGHDRRLPETSEGDVIVVATAGAYGAAMASHYNLRGLPREVLVF